MSEILIQNKKKETILMPLQIALKIGATHNPGL